MDDVTKLSYTIPVPLDEDGTPLANGERMIEVEPGRWAHPLLLAVTDYLEKGGRRSDA